METMKSTSAFRFLMRINVEGRGGAERIEVPDGSSPMDVLAALSLLPDAHIILRDGIPIPIDERLSDGDSLRLIKVASGG
jgi:sulfur carrier protein ThiS